MSELNLLWTILSIIVSVMGSIAAASWWLKGQLTSAEHAGLREQNTALREQAKLHEGYRQWAEDRAKVVVDRQKELTDIEAQAKQLEERANQLEEQLAEAQTTVATLQRQIAAGEKKEVLANTTSKVSGNILNANRIATLTSDERRQLTDSARRASEAINRLFIIDAGVLKDLAASPSVAKLLRLGPDLKSSPKTPEDDQTDQSSK